MRRAGRTRTILWSLTNSEIRVVSTSGSWEEEERTVRTQRFMFHRLCLQADTHSELLDEGDESAPGWVKHSRMRDSKRSKRCSSTVRFRTYRGMMPRDESLCLIRLRRPSLLLLCWTETLQIWTTTSHSSLAIRRLSLGPGSSLHVEARSWPSFSPRRSGTEPQQVKTMKVQLETSGTAAAHLYVRVVQDQRRRHLQRQVVVLSPVQHEGHTLLPNHLTQRNIWRETGRHLYMLDHLQSVNLLIQSYICNPVRNLVQITA